MVRLDSPYRDPLQGVQVLDHRGVDLFVQLDRGAGRAVVQGWAVVATGDELAPHLVQNVSVAGVSLPEALDDPKALANPAELDELHSILNPLLYGVCPQEPRLADPPHTLLAPLAKHRPEVAPEESVKPPADDGATSLLPAVEAEEDLGLPQVPPRGRRHAGPAGRASVGGLRGLGQLTVDSR